MRFYGFVIFNAVTKGTKHQQQANESIKISNTLAKRKASEEKDIISDIEEVALPIIGI